MNTRGWTSASGHDRCCTSVHLILTLAQISDTHFVAQVSLQILLDAREICERNAVDIQWRDGDVALLDNFLVMHARRIWNGPLGSRKLLASLVK